jgi:hypothetical protein
MPRARWFAIALVYLITSSLPSASIQARDRSFTRVIHGLNRDYHVKPKWVPGICLAKLALSMAHPSGLSKLDVALFEDRKLGKVAATPSFETRVQAMLGAGWKRLVQVDTPGRGEHVLMFARPRDGHMELFVFSIKPAEAVAVFVRVNPEALQRMPSDPLAPCWPILAGGPPNADDEWSQQPSLSQRQRSETSL